MERILEPEVMDTPEEAQLYDEVDHREENLAFVERLAELGARGSILDLGTGPGHIPVLVVERLPGVTVTAIDLSREMLLRAERHREASAHRDRLRFLVGDVKKVDYRDASFDTVYSSSVLHHIPDPRDLLREMKRLVRPGGCLLLRDLYRPASREQAEALGAKHAADGTDAHKETFLASLLAAWTSEELRALATEVGLTDARVVVDTDRHMSLQRAAAESVPGSSRGFSTVKRQEVGTT